MGVKQTPAIRKGCPRTGAGQPFTVCSGGLETVEKPASERLMENVQIQNFRNWGHPPAGWGVQAKCGQILRNEAYIEVRRSDLPS